MNNIIARLKRINWRLLLSYFIIFILFLLNHRYVSYPDEFVNLLGGKSLIHGGIPYVDFFDHHLPLAWFLSGILLVFSFGSYVTFRLLWTLVVFGLLALLGRWIRKNYPEFHPYYLGFLFFYPLMGVYFWFHLFLADSLAVLFFSLIFWILIVQTVSKKVSYRAIVVSSFLTFCLIFSSLTFLYLAGALYLWQMYLLKDYKEKIPRYLIWTVAPYVVFFLYLLITGSLQDFYFSNFVYNTKLYISIPNYVKGRFFNPIKFAFTLIFNFYGSYFPLLSKIKHLDLYLPIGTLAGLGTLTLLMLLFYRFLPVGIIFFFLLSFSAPRSDIQNYKETDYQASLFLVLGVASTFVAMYLLRRLTNVDRLVQDIGRIVQILLTIFAFFSFIFLLQHGYNKYYLRYTQKMPSILDGTSGALFMNDVVGNDEYFWIGPYEPNEEFFVRKGRLPGKYPTLLPQFREDEYLKTSFIDQFEKHPPKYILYKQEASIFGTPALEFGEFFLNWMKDKYTRLEKIPNINVKQNPTSFNLRGDLYILNSERDELLERMRSKGYIE